jgi:hypothetical protein
MESSCGETSREKCRHHRHYKPKGSVAKTENG